MTWAFAVAALLLSACYADTRLGVSAPVGHGHGGAEGDLGFGIGGDQIGNDRRLGGGAHAVLGGSDENAFVALGAELHGVFAFTGTYRDQYRWLAVSHVAIALAQGRGATQGSPDPASGAVADGFLGIGLGATKADPQHDVKAGHVGLGFAASRFFPVHGDAFWFLGGALELELTWGQPR